MLQFPYEAFVDEKTNLRQHKQAKLLSLIMEYIYNDGFEYIMYQPTWAQRIDGLRRVKSFETDYVFQGAEPQKVSFVHQNM